MISCNILLKTLLEYSFPPTVTCTFKVISLHSTRFAVLMAQIREGSQHAAVILQNLDFADNICLLEDTIEVAK